jgi:phosphopantetheinyl transferase
MPDDVAALQELAIVQWASRVRFRETVERMYGDGIGIFVECAPRNNLCAFVDDVLRNRPHLACPVDVEHRGGVEQFNHLIAQLAAEGVPLDLSGLYGGPSPAEATPARPLMKLQAGLQPFALAPRPAPPPVLAAPLPALETVRPNGAPSPTPTTSTPAGALGEPELVLTAPVAAAAPVGTTAGAAVATIVGEFAGPVSDDVDPVLSAHFDTMDLFLRQQQQIMEAYLGGGDVGDLPSTGDAAAPLPPLPVPSETTAPFEPARANGADHPAASAEPPSLPRLAGALATSPGRFPLLYRGEVSEVAGQVVIRVGWDVSEHLYLLDHTMGRAVSTHDATLSALPVVPFTFSMEALAEAAAAATERAVVAMREVRAHRWIALDDGHIDVELALPSPAEWTGDELRVALRRARGPGDERAHPPFVEGIVVLGRLPREAPLATAQHYRRERPSRWRPEELYTEVMFHGPKLRAIAAMERWGEDGSECTLVGLPREPLFSFTDAPEFLTDPITTDAMGQLIGMWVSDEHEDGMHDFPFRLEQFDVFGATLMPGERTLCRAKSELVGGEDVRNGFHRSDIEIVDAGGRVRFRMAGWWDMRFDMPERFHAARCHTDRVALARGMPEWLPPARDGLAAASVDDIPLDFLEPSGEFWLRALSQMMLNRTERDNFRAMTAVVSRRAEWLLGRIAAKDAVRDLLRRRGAPSVYPADIEIAAEAEGRPFVSAPWLSGRVPQISIAHKAGRAVAFAGESERFAGVGIDIETIEERPETFIEAAFAPAERALIAAQPAAERALATTRIWCAKEAVGKALGLALAEILSRLEAKGCGEVVRVALTADDGGKPRTFDATTVRDGDFVIALVAIPANN